METLDQVPHPPIASREEWLKARRELLAEEKAMTRAQDKLNAKRRRLPMVQLDKVYVLEGPQGSVSLREIIGSRRILIVYHFMFDPEWEDGCPGCTWFAESLAGRTIEDLAKADVGFALVSRAALDKLEAYKAKRGITLDWYSSIDSDFNYDFQATYDSSKAPLEFNFGPVEPKSEDGSLPQGENHGVSVFFRVGDSVYHTYSAYARGVEGMVSLAGLAEATPYGRQEDWEDSPEGFPQRPTYG